MLSRLHAFLDLEASDSDGSDEQSIGDDGNDDDSFINDDSSSCSDEGPAGRSAVDQGTADDSEVCLKEKARRLVLEGNGRHRRGGIIRELSDYEREVVADEEAEQTICLCGRCLSKLIEYGGASLDLEPSDSGGSDEQLVGNDGSDDERLIEYGGAFLDTVIEYDEDGRRNDDNQTGADWGDFDLEASDSGGSDEQSIGDDGNNDDRLIEYDEHGRRDDDSQTGVDGGDLRNHGVDNLADASRFGYDQEGVGCRRLSADDRCSSAELERVKARKLVTCCTSSCVQCVDSVSCVSGLSSRCNDATLGGWTHGSDDSVAVASGQFHAESSRCNDDGSGVTFDPGGRSQNRDQRNVDCGNGVGGDWGAATTSIPYIEMTETDGDEFAGVSIGGGGGGSVCETCPGPCPADKFPVLGETLSEPNFDRVTCLICDRQVKREAGTFRKLTEKLMANIKVAAAPPHDLKVSELTESYYNASTVLEKDFHGSMLSPNVSVNDRGHPFICSTCYRNVIVSKRPKAAIANYKMYPNHTVVSGLKELTKFELMLLSPSVPRFRAMVVRPHGITGIRSHVTALDARAEQNLRTVIDAVPRTEFVSVTMVGKATYNQKKRMEDVYDVRRSALQAGLRCMKSARSDLYEGIPDELGELPRIDYEFAEERAAYENLRRNEEDFRESAAGLSAAVENEVEWSHSLLTDDVCAKVTLNNYGDRQKSPMGSSDAMRLEDMYAHLFLQKGCGPLVTRSPRESFEQWLTHVLSLSGGVFSSSTEFILVANNIMRRILSHRRSFVRVKTKPKQTDGFAKVTVPEFEEWVAYKCKCNEARRYHQPCPSQPKGLAGAASLYENVMFEAGSYPCSKQECDLHRKKAKALCLAYGNASLFITVSPSPGGKNFILKLSGRDHGMVEVPLHTWNVAKEMPYESAAYFKEIVDWIHRDVLKWDVKKNKSLGAGLFGVVKAFYSVPEPQGSGNLHIHMSVWLEGFPSTEDEIVRLLECAAGKLAFCRYVCNVTTTTVLGADMRCPQCPRTLSRRPIDDMYFCRGCDISYDNGTPDVSWSVNDRGYACWCCGGDVESVTVPTSAFEAGGGATPCPTARCIDCDRHFTGDELQMMRVAHCLIARSMLDHNILAADGAYDTVKSVVESLSRSTGAGQDNCDKDMLAACDALIHVNHRRQHTSCFFLKSTRCRFHFPRSPTDATYNPGTQTIVPRRLAGSEYTNAYNRLIMERLHCNHDAQLVVSSASTMYIIKYQSKLNTETIDAKAAMRKLVDRMTTRILNDHTEEQSGTQKTELQIGIRIFRSLVYEKTNHSYVPATMAAFLLMGGQTAYFSHEFNNLNVGLGLHRRFTSSDAIFLLGTELMDFATDRESSTLRNLSSYDEYLLRPQEVDVSWLHYSTWYRLKLRSSGVNE